MYRDILHRAYLPPLRGLLPAPRQKLLDSLQKSIGGEIVVEGEEFFLSGEQGQDRVHLAGRGISQVGIVVAVDTERLSARRLHPVLGTSLKTNLNPGLYGIVIKMLLELQRAGVQVFFATHGLRHPQRA